MDLPETFEVHYAWKDSEKAKVVIGSTVNGISTVDIPNVALEQRRTITAYIYLSDTTEGETVNTIILSVNKRKAPENFEIPEDVDLFHHTLAATAEYQRQAKESEKQAAARSADAEAWAHGREDHPDQEQDNAKYYAEQAAASQRAAELSRQMVSDSVTQAQNDIGEAQQQAIKTITEQQGISIQKIKNQTAESEDNLKNTIRAAEQIKTDLDTEVENATPIKQGLDDSNTAAIKTKADLDKSNTIADQIKAELEVLNTTASKTKTNLDGANKTATDLTGTLENEISEGIQTKIDIQTTGEAAMSNLQAEATKQQEFIKTSIDDTLSISGKAADAAVTGKKIDSLKEDLGNLSSSKISKFYATNNGENHLADSDDGKIADMMVYGKSEQKKYQGYQLLEHNTSEYNFTATTSYQGLVNNASENIKSGAYYLRKLGNTPTVLITFLDASKKKVKQEYLTDKSEKRIVFETDVAYVKYIIQNLTVGTDYKGTVKLILALTSGADYEPYVGGIPSPNPDYPQEIKGVVNPTVKVTNKDGLKVQSVTLNNIALNAIPVSSGGNVTIDGQQYIADYVDVKRGKLVRMVGVTDQDTFETSKWNTGSIVIYSKISNVGTDNAIVTISSKFSADWSAGDEIHHFTQPVGQTLVIILPKTITTIEQGEEIRAKGFKFYYILVAPIEINLTEEEITALKELTTYYPTTNISVSSEQLDGYTVFNYPISMANGWNYVKQQLNDNRDYIYDMDIQSAEAYVNSEYAVALTELEV